MPKGTKVDNVYRALRRDGKDKGAAARIAQSKTGEALATGKPPRQKHPGALGETMRSHHNRKRMDYVRSHKEK